MKALTIAESGSWLLAHGGHLTSNGRPSLPAEGYRKVFCIPTESRAQIVLAHHLSRWIDAAGVLLWLTDWPIFSAEEMALFLEIRRRSGAQQALIDAPGHLVEGGGEQAIAELRTMLFLMMAFNWEGYLFQDNEQSTVWMADEIIEVVTRSTEKDQAMQRLLDVLHIETERTQ